MSDETVTLEFLARQLDRVLVEQRDLRNRITELADGQIVLTQMIFGVERSLVRVKDLLGAMENRLTRLETGQGH